MHRTEDVIPKIIEVLIDEHPKASRFASAHEVAIIVEAAALLLKKYKKARTKPPTNDCANAIVSHVFIKNTWGGDLYYKQHLEVHTHVGTPLSGAGGTWTKHGEKNA